MCIASGNISILKSFHKVCSEMKIRPVLLQNICALIESMPDIDYIGCFSFNSKGYMVNPSIDEVISYLKTIQICPSFGQCKLWPLDL